METLYDLRELQNLLLYCLDLVLVLKHPFLLIFKK